METLLKADIFFFVTTAVVVVLGILIVVALIYVLRILRNIDDISRKVKEEGSEIIQDVHELRRDLRARKVVVGIWSFLRKLLTKRR